MFPSSLCLPFWQYSTKPSMWLHRELLHEWLTLSPDTGFHRHPSSPENYCFSQNGHFLCELYRNKENFLLLPWGMRRSVTVCNTFRFVSRSSGPSGLALFWLWCLGGLWESQVLWALEARQEQGRRKSLPSSARGDRDLQLLQNLLYKR